MDRISVIIPTFNAAKYIEDAINSILSQNYKNVELIVCDDGSTDNTRELIRKYGSRVIYVYQKNQGCAAARNKAIAIASGELIAFLDADDRWLPDKLKTQVSIFKKRRNICLLFSDAYIIDEKGRRGKNLFKICPAYSGMVFKELLKDNFIPVITAVVKKEVFKEIGLFNPRYRLAEDWDLFLRISKQYPVAFVNKPLAEYRIHTGNISRKRDVLLEEIISIINNNIDLTDKTTMKCLKMKKHKFQFDLGMVYLQEGMRSKARDFFFAKVREEPFPFCFYLGLLVTYLPDSWIKFIGQILSSRGLHGLKYT